MASSASEDEKILRERELLEQLCQKEEVLLKELERVRRAKRNAEERLEKMTPLPPRSNQPRRQGMRLSLPPFVASQRLDPLQRDDPRSHAGDLVDVNSSPNDLLAGCSSAKASRSATLEAPRNQISAKSKIVPSSVATAFTGDSTDGRSEGTSVISSDGTDTFITPSRRKAHDVLVGRKGIKSHFAPSLPPILAQHLTRSSYNPTRSSTPNTTSSPAPSVPSNALDAYKMLDKIRKVQGFQYILDILMDQRSGPPLVNPLSLSSTAIEWPTLLAPVPFSRLLQQSVVPHISACPNQSSSATAQQIHFHTNTQTAASSCPTCTSAQQLVASITTFIGAAYLNQYPLIELHRIWDATEYTDWIARFVIRKEQALVRRGATLVLRCIEQEMQRLGLKVPTRKEKEDNETLWSMGPPLRNKI